MGIFNSKPKDTEPKGIGICAQPDWSAVILCCLFCDERSEHSKQCCVLSKCARCILISLQYDGVLTSWQFVKSL